MTPADSGDGTGRHRPLTGPVEINATWGFEAPPKRPNISYSNVLVAVRPQSDWGRNGEPTKTVSQHNSRTFQYGMSQFHLRAGHRRNGAVP